LILKDFLLKTTLLLGRIDLENKPTTKEKGFRLLTLGLTDGDTFIPLAFSPFKISLSEKSALSHELFPG